MNVHDVLCYHYDGRVRRLCQDKALDVGYRAHRLASNLRQSKHRSSLVVVDVHDIWMSVELVLASWISGLQLFVVDQSNLDKALQHRINFGFQCVVDGNGQKTVATIPVFSLPDSAPHAPYLDSTKDCADSISVNLLDWNSKIGNFDENPITIMRHQACLVSRFLGSRIILDSDKIVTLRDICLLASLLGYASPMCLYVASSSLKDTGVCIPAFAKENSISTIIGFVGSLQHGSSDAITTTRMVVVDALAFPKAQRDRIRSFFPQVEIFMNLQNLFEIARPTTAGHIANLVKTTLGMPSSAVVPRDVPVRELGIDSILTEEFVAALQDTFALHDLNSNVIFDYPCVDDLVHFLNFGDREAVVQVAHRSHESCAIIGAACRVTSFSRHRHHNSR